MCSIGIKIIFASIILVVFYEFDVVNSTRNRRRRVEPPSIDQLRQELQNLLARFNELGHGNPTINDWQELAQEFRNLEIQFSTHPAMTEAARERNRRSIAELEGLIAINIIHQINLQFGHIIGKLQNEHFGGTPHEYQDLMQDLQTLQNQYQTLKDYVASVPGMHNDAAIQHNLNVIGNAIEGALALLEQAQQPPQQPPSN